MPIIWYMCNQIRECLKNRTLLSNKKEQTTNRCKSRLNFKSILKKKKPYASYLIPLRGYSTKDNRIAMQSRLVLDKVDGRRELLRVIEMFCHSCGHGHTTVHVLQNHWITWLTLINCVSYTLIKLTKS